MPRQGSEVGIAAVGASFVLVVRRARPLDQRGSRTPTRARRGRGVGALGRSIGQLGAEGSRGRRSCPVAAPPHVVPERRRAADRRHPDRRPRGDDDVRRHARSRCSCTCTRSSTCAATAGSRTSTPRSSLFTASMLLLVVADNTLQLLVGWELVGLCSFMLIGHWWEEKPNTDAAVKAFLTTRTGDIGLLIGVIMTLWSSTARPGTARSTSSRSTRRRRARHGRPHARDVDRARVAARDHRQVGSVPAAHVAARRDGRPHAGLGADPRGHDGRRRRLPRRARSTRCSGTASRSARPATAGSTRWR